MKKKGFLFTGLFILVLVPAFPQEILKDTISMDEVVVTGSKTPQSVGNVTQKIDIIESKEIGNLVSGNRNISEALMYKPGASVSALSRNDANWGTYGGIGPKYSTYMLQGLPIDAFVDPMALDLNAIDRIEVQRGPASVLYPNYLSQDFAGNQSPLAGTVNLILKDRIEKPFTNISAAYGSYNTINGNVFHENQFGDLHIMGSFSIEKSDYTNYGSENSWLNMIDNPQYQKIRFFAGGTYVINSAKNQKIDFFANQTFHTGDAGRPNRGFDHSYTLMHLGYSGDINDVFGLGFKVGYRAYNRSNEEDNYSTNKDITLKETDKVKQSIVPADFFLTFKPVDFSKLTMGADFQSATYITKTDSASGAKTEGNDAKASQIGYYLQEELTLDKAVVRGGLRYVSISNDITKLGGIAPIDKNRSWGVLLWNAGIKYKATDNISPFFNIGTSFMSPGLKSIGGTILAADTMSSGQIPNPDLKPEKGTGIDFGADYKISNSISFSARLFYYSITDAIVENSIRNTPTTSQSKSVNAGKTIAKGFELELKQRISKSLYWFANYTHFETEIVNKYDADQNGSNVSFVPDNVSNFGLTAWLPWQITVSPYVHFAGKIYDGTSKSGRTQFGSYELVNMNISKSLTVFNTNFDIFANLYNITDNRFEMPWQFRDPGFSMMAGIRAKF
jgi:iron complex outermembrane recepter protein